MIENEKAVSKNEIQELAEAMAIFNKFPERERLAIKYYLKGRLDAERGNIEIPIEFTRGSRAMA